MKKDVLIVLAVGLFRAIFIALVISLPAMVLN